MEPLSRIDRKKHEARARILKAAEQLFVAESSYDQATIRAIARRADVSIGALYSHFRTKADILAALVASRGMLIQAALRKAVDAGRKNGRQRVEALLDGLEALRSDRTIVLYGRLIAVSPLKTVAADSLEKARSTVGEFTDYLSAIIDEGKADRSIRSDIDTRLAAVTITTAVMAFMREVVFTQTPSGFDRFFSQSPDQVYRTFNRFLVDSLAPARSRK